MRSGIPVLVICSTRLGLRPCVTMVPLLIVTKLFCSQSGWKSRTRGLWADGVPGISCNHGRQVCFTVVLIKAVWTYKEIIIQGKKRAQRCSRLRYDKGNHNDDDKSCCVATLLKRAGAPVFFFMCVWKMFWPFEVTVIRNCWCHNDAWASNEDGCLHIHQALLLRWINFRGQDELSSPHLAAVQTLGCLRWQVA